MNPLSHGSFSGIQRRAAANLSLTFTKKEKVMETALQRAGALATSCNMCIYSYKTKLNIHAQIINLANPFKLSAQRWNSLAQICLHIPKKRGSLV